MPTISWYGGLLVFSILKCSTAQHRDSSALRINQVATDATAESALQRDPLLRALQKTAKTRVEPVIPGQQMEHVNIDGVSSGNGDTSARSEVGGKAALSSPALANV